jgi:hypothetical protein
MLFFMRRVTGPKNRREDCSMSLRWRFIPILVWVSLGLVVSTALAQVDHAALNGTVTDASGAVIPGAKVEAVSLVTGYRHETFTSAAGTYQIPGLAIGLYTVTISKEGFKSDVSKDVDLAVGQPRTLDARLEVGAATEVVEVTARVETLSRTSAEVGGLVESKQIDELPVNGRNWASLMLFAPGAINYGDGAQRAIRFNGHSLDDSNFAFDGVDTSGVQEQTQKADTRLNIALDAIAEFRVSTAVYTAESGAAGGAQINVVSKTGSNVFHGTGFYALRNDKLDARSPFDVETLPPFTLHQFGGGVGGAIVKDKAFFYANYEGLRQSLGHTLINYVPNAAYRAQVLATSPVLKPILDAYPMGQTPVDDITDQLTKVATDTVREDSGMYRFDYRFNDRTTAYFRFNIDDAYIDNPSDAMGTHDVIPHRPTNYVLQMLHTFSPTTVNEVKFGINRANYHAWTYGTAPIAASPGPFDGVSDTALDTEVGTTFGYIDNLTTVRGRHTLKFGVDIRRIRLNNSGNTLTTSTISYDTADDFINNVAADAEYDVGEGVVGNRRTFYQDYAQDDFKATRNLTLNLGLRYEYYSVMHEIHDRSAVVDIEGCGGFCPKGTPYYSPNRNDWGPRIGLAWSPAMFHGKTTIRTGFGIYFGGNQNDDFSDPAESAVPRYSWTVDDIPNLSYPLTPFLDPAFQLFSPKAIDRHRKDLSYEQWDFMVQQELPQNFLLQVGYVGGKGTHLFSPHQVNLIDPATGERPLAGFGQFKFKANDSNNTFNALQVSLQRRFVNGFSFQMNYMWSHGITDGSNGSGEGVSFQNMSCRACDRSNSSIDVRHTLYMNAIYELPFGGGKRFLNQGGVASHVFGGWELAGIAAARTGLPVDISMTRKANTLLDGNTKSQRPDLVPGASIYASNPSINGWFNPDAFANPADFVWGNLGRYAAFGPKEYELDTTLQKRFMVTERLALNFRATAYNLFNHPQYGNPASNISKSSFGTITDVLNDGATGSGAPRRIEFMFRAEF